MESIPGKLSQRLNSDASLLGQPGYANTSLYTPNFFSNVESDDQAKLYLRTQHRLQRRVLRVKELCSNNPSYKIIIAKPRWYNIAFGRIQVCKLPKSGTTFLAQNLNHTIKIINKTRPFLSKNKKRILLVRDPYARLVSAFFSKLVAHPYWWDINKHYVIPLYRTNPSKISLRCGHDTSFPEFVKFIIGIHTKPKLRGYRDKHFLRTIEVCNVCAEHNMPDYIATLETIKDDMDYILDSVGTVGDTSQSFVEVEHMARLFLSYKEKKFKNCGPMCPILRRYWWSQQATGQISKDVDMPLSELECEKITPDDFAMLARVAHLKLKGRFDKQQQRWEIMREIFSQVSINDKEELRKLLSIECRLFGYSDRPDYVFSNTT